MVMVMTTVVAAAMAMTMAMVVAAAVVAAAVVVMMRTVASRAVPVFRARRLLQRLYAVEPRVLQLVARAAIDGPVA